MELLGWIDGKRPRMYSIQTEGCAPIVRAFERNEESAEEWQSPRTAAWGLRVPRAVGDRLMLKALRDSHGGAVAVTEESIEPAAAEVRSSEGVDCGPEGGAALAGLEKLLARGAVSPRETIVMFNTGGNKYH